MAHRKAINGNKKVEMPMRQLRRKWWTRFTKRAPNCWNLSDAPVTDRLGRPEEGLRMALSLSVETDAESVEVVALRARLLLKVWLSAAAVS